MEVSLERVEKFAHAPVDSLEMKMQQYDQWSAHFENDVAQLTYSAPKLAVDLLFKVAESQALTWDKNTKYIDFAAGTGLVARCLQEKSFAGEIDAQDGSVGMLQIAKEKELYRNIYHCIIKPEIALPLPHNHYDVGFICGALSDSQVHPLCLQVMLSHIKTDGIFIFSTRSNKSNLEYKITLDCEVKKLVDAKVLEKINVEHVEKFERATSSEEVVQSRNKDEPNEPYPFVSGAIYCYKKLK